VALRSRSCPLFAPILLASVAAAFGQQGGDATAGRRLAEASCLQCHGSPTAKVKAPAFAAIAAMPSTTAQALGVFLRTSHAAMPNLILSASERDDVIAYILSLRP
jgi:mono/diheme cytochrome c family protein